MTKHAFIWRNDGTPIQDLGTLGGTESYANALNDSGQVAGWADTRGSQIARLRVAERRDSDEESRDLRGSTSAAYDMNSSGQVTGYAYLAGNVVSHAFLWRNDGSKIQDLNKLIDPTDPLSPT